MPKYRTEIKLWEDKPETIETFTTTEEDARSRFDKYNSPDHSFDNLWLIRIDDDGKETIIAEK